MENINKIINNNLYKESLENLKKIGNFAIIL